MTAPAARPHVDPTPWLFIGLGTAVAAAAGLLWLGGTLAAWATGDGWHPPPFGTGFARALLHSGPAGLWPATDPRAVWTVTGVLVVLVTVAVTIPVARWQARRPQPGDPLPSMARPADVADLAPAGAADLARRLRPSLGDKPRPDDVGLPLGDLEPRGPQLRASWESTVLTVMAPRSGKTTRIAARAVLAAPGGVVATSNKSDLLAITAQRRALLGAVSVFDPQAVAHYPQRFWWDPLAAVHGVEDAHRLALHFLSSTSDRDFWDLAAHELLTALMLAAAVTPGASLTDVYVWLTDSRTPTPVRSLLDAGHSAVAASLRGMQSGAAETREGIFQNARTAAQALRDPAITRWVTPQPDLPSLDPAGVVRGSSDTLYLLSKDGAGSAAPLTAALTDAVFRAGTRAAEARGGRLDPPCLAMLDEAANIVRIADLPDLYSHLGSRGIVPVTILQSYRQGQRVWGDDGMAALWGAATVKVIGPGIDDADFAEDLSRLVGDHDVETSTYSRRLDGTTESTGSTRRRILEAADIRALPRGRALLFITGARAAMIRLRSYLDDDATLDGERVQFEERLRARAAVAP